MKQAVSGLPQKYRSGLVWLPLLFLAVLVYARSVNVPFWDEWELVPIFQHLHAGHFLWSDFWRQHNEHRLFFPTLALTGLAYLTHWNLQIECFAGLVVAAGSFVLLRKVIARSLDLKRETALLFLLALLWFSPVQVENWLWGWQLEWFMNVLGVVLAVFGLARIRERRIAWPDLALIIGGGILAQYSLGNGTLLWPIAIAALLYIRVRIEATALVALTGLATTFLYYFHYTAAGEPSKTLAAHRPLQFAEYVLGYLGRPLSFYHKPAMAFGGLLLAVFVSLSVYLLVRHRTAFDKALPWVALGLYAIGSSLITGLARLGFGVSEAYSSRYTTISSLLLASVIMICRQNRPLLEKLIRDKHKAAFPALTLTLVCLLLVEAGWGVRAAGNQYRKLTAARSCSRAADPDAACLSGLYPNTLVVAPRVQYAKSIRWGGY